MDLRFLLEVTWKPKLVYCIRVIGPVCARGFIQFEAGIHSVGMGYAVPEIIHIMCYGFNSVFSHTGA